MADTVVGIGADLGELRRELAKLPNLSAEAAQKTLIQVEKAVQKAEKAAKKSAKDISKVQKQAAREAQRAAEKAARAQEQALKNVGDTAGDTESSIRAISGALGMVSPEAEDALNTIAELAGATEGLTKGTEILGGSLGTMSVALGVAAVAAAALGTAYLVAKNESEKAAEQSGRLAARVEETRDRAAAAALRVRELSAAWEAYNSSAQGWRDQIDLINVKISETELQTRKATDALREQARTSLLAAGTLVASLEMQIAANEDAIKSGKLAFEEEARLVKQQGELKDQLKEAEKALKDKKDQLEADIKTVTQAIEYNYELGKSNEYLAERDRQRAEAARKAAEKRSEALEQEREAAQLLADILLSDLAPIEQEMVKLSERMAEVSLLAADPKLAEEAAAALAVLTKQMEALQAQAKEEAFTEALKAAEEEMESGFVPAMTHAQEEAEALMDAVDSLVSPKALSEIDQLTVYLYQLEAAQLAAGGESVELAERIETVKKRMDDLDDESVWDKFAKGAAKAVSAVKSVKAGVEAVLGAISQAVGYLDQFIQLAGGFSLSDLASVAAEGSVTRDVLDEDGNVTGTETLGPGQVVSEMFQAGVETIALFVESIPEIVQAFVAELPTLIEAFIAAISPVTEALVNAIPDVVDALLDGVLGVFEVIEGEEPRILKLVERLASKLVDFISSEGGRLVNQALEFGSNLLVTLIRGVPGLVDAILQQLPFIIIELLDGVGEVVTALIAAIPEIIASIIANLPAIVQALIMAIPQLILEIIVALTKLGPQITIALTKQILLVIARIREVVGAELDRFREQGVVEYVKGLWDRLKGRLKVWIRELFFTGSDADSLAGLGDAAQQAFNDTPGPVRAGMRGLTARFAPGDTVIAAKDTRELMRQAQAASGSSGGGSRVVLDLQDGHLAFERMFKRSRRSGGELSKLLGPDAGQVKVYG